jgi:hypothetical protein
MHASKTIIRLPGADAADHNVMWNYFIMVEKQ